MTTRMLPVKEWSRLTGTLLADVYPHFDADRARVLVVEDGPAVVACAALFPVWHFDGVWIAPAVRRRVSVGRLLLRAVRALFVTEGIREVWAMTTSTEGRALIRRTSAVHMACDHFAVDARSV